MKALLLANGDAPRSEFLQSLAAQHDLVIAIDGAVYKAIEAGLAPQIVCGDFDSIDIDSARQALPQAEFMPLPDQNLTDVEKTIKLAIGRGATAITIAGAFGGRIDHALGSLAVLLRYHKHIDLRIAGEDFDLWVVSDASRSFATNPGDTISLLSFSENTRVTVSNVKWPLDSEELPIGTLGISNVALGDSVAVDVKGDPLVVCRLR